jgi:hypothetical protein
VAGLKGGVIGNCEPPIGGQPFDLACGEIAVRKREQVGDFFFSPRALPANYFAASLLSSCSEPITKSFFSFMTPRKK